MIMKMTDVVDLATRLQGVRHSTSSGLDRWQFHGRLIARQLDDTSIVIRADFEYRDLLLRQSPATFRVPQRFKNHMMVVVDLPEADVGAVEDALEAAWLLQLDGA
ncbi:hypothetical protein CIK75_00155 [Glutamicibacter sp. BW78]|nr:hypothetical protein CIK75_00155 [Glutamicibacter sp. BW78]